MSRPEDPRYKWYLAGFLCLVGIVNYADRTAISAVFPLVRAELGLSDVALAAIGSFFLWSYAAGSPVAGVWADRVSRSRMVTWSLVAWSLVTIGTGLSRGAGALLVTRVLLGLTECAYLPAALALLSEHHTGKSRATAMGIHLAGLNFGLVAGGTLAGALGDHFGWRISFFVLGVLGLLLAAVAGTTLRDAAPPPGPAQAPRQSSPWRDIAGLARVPSFVLLLAAAMSSSIATWIFFNWLPLYFKETFQMSLTGAGFSGTFLLQMAATMGALAGGYASDRVAARKAHHRMLYSSLCYFSAAPFLLAFLGPPVFTVVGAAIALFAFLRALGGVNDPTITCDLLEPRVRSTALALMNTINCFAGGVGVMIAGFLKQSFGLGGIFGGVTAIIFVAASFQLVGYLFFFRRDLERVQAGQLAGLSSVSSATETARTAETSSGDSGPREA